MKPITLLDEGLDDTTPRPAFLITDIYALSITGGALWLDRVILQADGTYVASGGISLTENIRRGDALVPEVYAKLRTMTAFDFVTTMLLPPGIDIEMFPAATT